MRTGNAGAASAIAVVVAAGCLAACGSSDPTPTPTFTVDKLMDPATCQQCHAQYFTEWSGSMHAYASIDPVFRAMNARGQRETGGKLGSFCVNCHAPLAVQQKATVDGSNLDSVPAALQGVTCYFCHQVTEVQGTHNNPLVLANDTTMRGGIKDPAPNPAHHGAYSSLHDSSQISKSSSMCGSCHDIVVPAHFSGAAQDVPIERTYQEYLDSLFSKPPPTDKTPESCGFCHMGIESEGVPIASAKGLIVPANRTRHFHDFPGVDLALTDFPQKDAQRASVQSVLQAAVNLQLCVATADSHVTVVIENVGAAHKIPSGASQDRRMWIELHAAANVKGALTEVYSSGVVPPGGSVTDLIGKDPGLWLFRDVALKKDGSPAHMFWDVASIDDSATQKQKPIPATLTLDSTDQTGRYHVELLSSDHVPFLPGYKFPTPPSPLQVVTLTLHVQAIGTDVLRDLVQSGDLSGSVAAEGGVRDAGNTDILSAMRPIDVIPNPGDGGVTTTLTWTPSTATPQTVNETDALCVTTGALR